MGDPDLSETPLADRRVRGLVGLAGSALIATVAVLVFEGVLLWLLLGIAVLDLLVTPYMLGVAVEGGRGDNTTEWGDD